MRALNLPRMKPDCKKMFIPNQIDWELNNPSISRRR
jgi:hypothetical protein